MINSPVCTGRILLFPSLVLVTDLRTTGPGAACTHRESVVYADVFTRRVCPLVTLCVHHMAAALF